MVFEFAVKCLYFDSLKGKVCGQKVKEMIKIEFYGCSKFMFPFSGCFNSLPILQKDIFSL